MRAAPQLQRVLAGAIADGGWFDTAHEQAVREAASEADRGAPVAVAADAARRGDPARRCWSASRSASSSPSSLHHRNP